MMITVTPFEFKECIGILKATGMKAKTLRELKEIIAIVTSGSIHHHTYQYFLKDVAQEYTNDFARWAGESLEERGLAEKLSILDPYEFETTEEVRNALVAIIDDFLGYSPEPREASVGDEFFFNETVTFVVPTGVVAKNLAEFLMALKYIDPASIYYHYHEARVRLRGTDDFSQWILDSLGKRELAESIRSIDPFMNGIEDIRARLIAFTEAVVKGEMETADLPQSGSQLDNGGISE